METQTTNHTPTTVNEIRAALLAAGIDPKGSRNRPALAKRLAKIATVPATPDIVEAPPVPEIPAVKPAKRARKAPAVADKAPKSATAPTDAGSVVKRMHKAGESIRAMGLALEAMKIKTPRGGKKWAPSSVQSALRRVGIDAGGIAAK